MNGRIEQMMADASGGACYDGNQLALYGEDIEKFAELIVREAGEAFWSEACHVSDLAYEEYSRNSKKIKEHFGVEL